MVLKKNHNQSNGYQEMEVVHFTKQKHDANSKGHAIVFWNVKSILPVDFLESQRMVNQLLLSVLRKLAKDVAEKNS